MSDIITLSLTLEQFTSIEDGSTSPLEVVYVHVSYKRKEQTQKTNKDACVHHLHAYLNFRTKCIGTHTFIYICMYVRLLLR